MVEPHLQKMMTKKLLFSHKGLINIYVFDNGKIMLEREDYSDEIKNKSSLIQLLPLFELPVDGFFENLRDKKHKIEDIFPINELLLFLVSEMRSSYWVSLVFSFLLNDRVHFRLNRDVIDYLLNEDLSRWLPQKERHCIRKIVNKSLQ